MRLMRIADVVQSTGLSRMTIYRLERAGEFPARRRLGRNSVAWLDNDIATWIDSRPAVARLSRGSVPVRRNDTLRPR
jgi:prophage regulatory protein